MNTTSLLCIFNWEIKRIRTIHIVLVVDHRDCVVVCAAQQNVMDKQLGKSMHVFFAFAFADRVVFNFPVSSTSIVQSHAYEFFEQTHFLLLKKFQFHFIVVYRKYWNKMHKILISFGHSGQQHFVTDHSDCRSPLRISQFIVWMWILLKFHANIYTIFNLCSWLCLYRIPSGFSIAVKLSLMFA